MFIKDLTGEQRRQGIDAQQAWSVWRDANAEKQRRFMGGMRWAERASGDYLLRKTGASERSLGPRSAQTEEAFDAFIKGRAANREILTGVSKKLDQMAPVNRAMGLGRMPVTPARIVRRCDEKNLLGEQIFIVGTNALYAYEALAGIHFESGLIATADIDLLLDTRRQMSLVTSEGIRSDGLIGVLQKADRSFKALRNRSFRAVNKDGYLVDLICPQEKNVMRPGPVKALSALNDDLEGAETFGLEWLINAPKVEAVVLDERGFPAPVVVVDPRVYALHKFWLSGRKDRSKIKAKRDLEQARAVWLVAKKYLQLDFGAPDLSALPEALRQAPAGLCLDESEEGFQTPDW